MMRFSQVGSTMRLAIGALAVVVLQVPQSNAQFAWHGPQTFTTGVMGNPSFVQAVPGTYGTMGNYELIVPLRSGGIGHFFRNNDDPNLAWSGPVVFGTSLGGVDAVSLIQSNFTSSGTGPGNLAVVARTGDQLDYFFREDVNFTWSDPQTITTGVTGVPSFVQAIPGTYGAKGNYELVCPLRSGGIGYFERNNDDPNLPWSEAVSFGADLGIVDAVSIIQSNFTSSGSGPGNLAVIARVGNNLYYFFREDVTFTWSAEQPITTGVTGNPSFVQARPGTYGSKGNYELAIPLRTGGIGYFERNNDDPNLSWSQPVSFGTTLGIVDGVSLIQSNFSTAGNGPGNLAVVSVTGDELDYFYRDDQ